MASYGGSDALLNLDIQYEYQGHFTDSFEEIVNMMNISLVHDKKNLVDMVTDFDQIGNNMKELAKSFLIQNGKYKTGNLYNSIGYQIIGHTLNLNAPARDKRGHPYAGHIEYGFTGRDGIPRGPWPFLRPAVRLAAADSRDQLGEALASFLANETLMKNGKMRFGRSGNSINSYNSNRVVKETQYRFGSHKFNNRQWETANHGIKSKNQDSFFHQSNDYKWRTGELS